MVFTVTKKESKLFKVVKKNNYDRKFFVIKNMCTLLLKYTLLRWLVGTKISAKN